jgi:predicted PurR-regulated permease PerM
MNKNLNNNRWSWMSKYPIIVFFIFLIVPWLFHLPITLGILLFVLLMISQIWQQLGSTNNVFDRFISSTNNDLKELNNRTKEIEQKIEDLKNNRKV